MPPKAHEVKKSVSFVGSSKQPKGKSGPAKAASPVGEKTTTSQDAPLLVEAVSTVAVASDGAPQSTSISGAAEALDNQGFVPPLERHDYRPSGDDGEVVTMDDGEEQARRDEVVDIDELPVDDDG